MVLLKLQDVVPLAVEDGRVQRAQQAATLCLAGRRALLSEVRTPNRGRETLRVLGQLLQGERRDLQLFLSFRSLLPLCALVVIALDGGARRWRGNPWTCHHAHCVVEWLDLQLALAHREPLNSVLLAQVTRSSLVSVLDVDVDRLWGASESWILHQLLLPLLPLVQSTGSVEQGVRLRSCSRAVDEAVAGLRRQLPAAGSSA